MRIRGKLKFISQIWINILSTPRRIICRKIRLYCLISVIWCFLSFTKYIRAVESSLFWILTSMPLDLSNSSQTSKLALLQAMWRGVQPLLSFVFTFACCLEFNGMFLFEWVEGLSLLSLIVVDERWRVVLLPKPSAKLFCRTHLGLKLLWCLEGLS